MSASPDRNAESKHPEARRAIDGANLTLLLVGLACGALLYIKSTHTDIPMVLFLPSAVAVALGASGLFKRQAPHDTSSG